MSCCKGSQQSAGRASDEGKGGDAGRRSVSFALLRLHQWWREKGRRSCEGTLTLQFALQASSWRRGKDFMVVVQVGADVTAWCIQGPPIVFWIELKRKFKLSAGKEPLSLQHLSEADWFRKLFPSVHLILMWGQSTAHVAFSSSPLCPTIWRQNPTTTLLCPIPAAHLHSLITFFLCKKETLAGVFQPQSLMLVVLSKPTRPSSGTKKIQTAAFKEHAWCQRLTCKHFYFIAPQSRRAKSVSIITTWSKAGTAKQLNNWAFSQQQLTSRCNKKGNPLRLKCKSFCCFEIFCH